MHGIPEELQQLNTKLKRFNVPAVTWTEEQARRIRYAKVTYTVYTMVGSFDKISDVPTRTLAITKAYCQLTNQWKLRLNDLPEFLMKKITPMVS